MSYSWLNVGIILHVLGEQNAFGNGSRREGRGAELGRLNTYLQEGFTQRAQRSRGIGLTIQIFIGVSRKKEYALVQVFGIYTLQKKFITTKGIFYPSAPLRSLRERLSA
jgi:hypothetical protein